MTITTQTTKFAKEWKRKQKLANREDLSYCNLNSPLLRRKDVHAALPIHFLHVAKEAGKIH
jgi:hypothetical protein